MKLLCSTTRVATCAIAGLLITTGHSHAGHVYAGIIDTNGTPGLQNGDALAFVDTSTTNAIVDGSPLTGASLGTLALTLVTSAASPQLGLYRSSSPTFTALSRGLAYEAGAYVTNGNAFAASAGSFIQLEIVNVTGPAGAEFRFWDGTSVLYSVTIGGAASGNPTFDLTERTVIVGNGVDTTIEGDYDPVTPGRQDPTYPNAFNDPLDTTSNWRWNDPDGVGGAAPADPFGHIHGRSFTFSQPGDYTVSYRLKDTSGQHADSAAFVVSYSNPVPEPGSLAVLLGGAGALAIFRHRRRTRD